MSMAFEVLAWNGVASPAFLGWGGWHSDSHSTALASMVFPSTML